VFYNTTSGNVASGANCPLSTQATGNTTGAFTLASNAVTVLQAGTYLIAYHVQIFNNLSTSYAIFTGSTQVAGTVGVGTSSAAIKLLSGFTVVTLNANTIVSIRNVGTGTDTLAGSVGGVQAANVMLLIQRVG
jgi:hypothetical protein